jgi:hypothetical protein
LFLAADFAVEATQFRQVVGLGVGGGEVAVPHCAVPGLAVLNANAAAGVAGGAAFTSSNPLCLDERDPGASSGDGCAQTASIDAEWRKDVGQQRCGWAGCPAWGKGGHGEDFLG